MLSAHRCHGRRDDRHRSVLARRRGKAGHGDDRLVAAWGDAGSATAPDDPAPAAPVPDGPVAGFHKAHRVVTRVGREELRAGRERTRRPDSA